MEELKRIAGVIKKRNSRNAGRKKKFSPEEVEEIRSLLKSGMTIREAAEKYHTSRQVIGKYLNTAPRERYTLQMTYMYRQHPCTIIDVDLYHRKVRIQNRTGDLLHRAFGVLENPTWEDFELFLKDRCFPETRGDVRELLQGLGLTDYDPLQIVEKTRGKDSTGCSSRSFQAENEMLVSFEKLHRAYLGQGLAAVLGKLRSAKERIRCIRYTVDFLERTLKISGIGSYLTLLLELDAFF